MGEDGKERRARFARELAEVETAQVEEPAGPAALRLCVVGEASSGSHPLPASGTVTIGRAEDAAIRIDDTSISRQHARLMIAAGTDSPATLTIEDAGSSNGTRVRGRRLEPHRPVSIAIGEPIELGHALVIVQRAPARTNSGAAPADRRDPVFVPAGGRAMARVRDVIDRVAPTDLSVLILGETGAGKEVIAESVHRRSKRSGRPLLKINCAALSEALLESELFGHERGAFSGAVEAKAGLLETAEGGTVFLDEIGEMPPSIQAKLLRVLEDRKLRRVGALEARAVDVRFVSATNRDLESECARGGFRTDLFYRLNGLSIAVPPLRERVDEIRPLAESFARAIADQLGAPPPRITEEGFAALEAHRWPGNVRELKNTVERAVVLAGAGAIGPPELGLAAGRPSPARGNELRGEIEDLERRRILEALEACGGVQRRAAKMLGMSRNTLLARLDAYQIPRPKKDR